MMTATYKTLQDIKDLESSILLYLHVHVYKFICVK